MSDDYLVQKMAVLWTENGGDVKGYDFCIRRIRDAIDKILAIGGSHAPRVSNTVEPAATSATSFAESTISVSQSGKWLRIVTAIIYKP